VFTSPPSAVAVATITRTKATPLNGTGWQTCPDCHPNHRAPPLCNFGLTPAMPSCHKPACVSSIILVWLSLTTCLVRLFERNGEVDGFPLWGSEGSHLHGQGQRLGELCVSTYMAACHYSPTSPPSFLYKTLTIHIFTSLFVFLVKRVCNLRVGVVTGSGLCENHT
jgi:hypothetical protein